MMKDEKASSDSRMNWPSESLQSHTHLLQCHGVPLLNDMVRDCLCKKHGKDVPGSENADQTAI